MARPFAAPTPSLPPCGVALVAVLHLLLSTLASSGAESYAMTWGDQAASGYGATAHARSGLDRWRPATVTVCTSEYRPFVFPREDYALVKYLIHKDVLRLRSFPELPKDVKKVAERYPYDTKLKELLRDLTEKEAEALMQTVANDALEETRKDFTDSPKTLHEFSAGFHGFDVDLMLALSTFQDANASYQDTNFTIILKGTYPSALWSTKIGECDMAIGGYTRTARRAECSEESNLCNHHSGMPGAVSNPDICCLAWSQVYQETGISFLSRRDTEDIGGILARNLATPLNGIIVSALAITLIASGHLIWYIERHHNTMFPKGYLDGVDDGIWWSLTTVTTVGYGDKVPVTMTGRFIAFLWMIIGLIMFAFFTSTITGLVADVEAEQIILPVEDVYKMVLSEINNTVKLCTVKGVYEEILPSANKNIDILDSISDCYRRFEEQDGTKHQTVLMFDRATLFYDLKGHRQTYMRPPYMDPNDRNVSMAVAKANINLPKHLNREAWGLRDGIVISRPVRTTYAAVAFPAKDPKQHPLSGQTHVAVVNRALQIILSSPGGFFMQSTSVISQKRSLLASVSPLRMVTLVYLLPSDPISQGTGGGVIGMEHHQTLELGWSIEESRNVWLPVEFGAKNEDISIPSPYQRSGRGWEETSKGCLTTAVVVLITYLGVQFGGLYYRRRRKIKRILNGTSRMPSGIKNTTDLPFSYNDPSPSELQQQHLRMEITHARKEIENIKEMVTQLSAAVNSQAASLSAANLLMQQSQAAMRDHCIASLGYRGDSTNCRLSTPSPLSRTREARGTSGPGGGRIDVLHLHRSWSEGRPPDMDMTLAQRLKAAVGSLLPSSRSLTRDGSEIEVIARLSTREVRNEVSNHAGGGVD